MYSNESKGHKLPPLAPYGSVRGDTKSSHLLAAPHAAAIVPDYLIDLDISQCPSDLEVDSNWAVVDIRLPANGDFEQWKQDALDAQDTVSYDYYLCAELGRSYNYKGYIATNVQEYYGIWGATTINPYVASFVNIMGIGQRQYKSYEDDLDIYDSFATWPIFWVPNILANATPAKVASGEYSIGTAGSDTVYRLREGVERYLITDINAPPKTKQSQTKVPVLWDTFGSNASEGTTSANAVFNHIPGGSNVLYLDGHVKFVQYGEKYPLSSDIPFVEENSHFGML